MMNKKVFISYSFENKNEFVGFNENLKNFLKENNFESYSFVFDPVGKFESNKDLMNKALEKIDESDIVIAELSYKRIGIGVEIGYAKAKGKNIIYIHKIGSDISTTVDGVSGARIEYKDLDDLFLELKKVLLI